MNCETMSSNAFWYDKRMDDKNKGLKCINSNVRFVLLEGSNVAINKRATFGSK